MGCVYLLTFPNGKGYVGMTKFSAEKRLKRHFHDARWPQNKIMYHALKKLSRDDIILQTLFMSDDMHELQEQEIHFIEKLKTRAPSGYNLTRGGDGALGLDKETEERRRASISKSLTGKKLSDEHRANLSISHKGLVSPRKGTTASSETKKKMSLAAKNRWARDRESILLSRDTPQYRNNLSKGVKRSWERRRGK
ncbi:MAG: NUMOD3 domain-containing DNA-binding protein [Anaerolineae bacterium]